MKHLEFPMPPSVNSCYATNFKTKRRFKSKKYQEWVDQCSQVFSGRKIKIIGDEWLEVTYTFFFPLRTKKGEIKKKDVENYIKPTSDMLGHYIEGFDDAKIKRLVVEKKNSKKSGVVIIIKETTL